MRVVDLPGGRTDTFGFFPSRIEAYQSHYYGTDEGCLFDVRWDDGPRATKVYALLETRAHCTLNTRGGTLCKVWTRKDATSVVAGYLRPNGEPLLVQHVWKGLEGFPRRKATASLTLEDMNSYAFRRGLPPLFAAPQHVAQAWAAARQVDESKEDLQVPATVTAAVPVLHYKSLGINSSTGRIGEGAFGVVYAGRMPASSRSNAGRPVAVKQPSANNHNSLALELQVMAELGQNSNIIKLLGYCKQPPAMVMEHAELGSLNTALHHTSEAIVQSNLKAGSLRLRIAHQVADGLRAMHHCGVIHCDVKSDNVLLTADYDAKLCDFGLSQIRGRTGSTMKLSEHAKNAGAGTMAYMAPELLNLDTDANPQTDVYSFGILLNELATCEQPYRHVAGKFQGRGPDAIARYAASGKRPSLAGTDQASASMQNLITACWHKDPAKRPTFDVIVSLLRDDAAVTIYNRSAGQHVRAQREDGEGTGTGGSAASAGTTKGAPAGAKVALNTMSSLIFSSLPPSGRIMPSQYQGDRPTALVAHVKEEVTSAAFLAGLVDIFAEVDHIAKAQKMLNHLVWESKEVTATVVEAIRVRVEARDCEALIPAFAATAALARVDDSLRDWRVDSVLKVLLATMMQHAAQELQGKLQV